MIDSPVVTGWRAMFVKVFRTLGLLDRYSPAQFSLKRRMIWKDKQEAFGAFFIQRQICDLATTGLT